MLNFDLQFRRGNKIIPIFSFGDHFVGRCITVKGTYEEHLCEIMLNLDQQFRRRCKIFPILSSDNHFVGLCRTVKGTYDEHLRGIMILVQ